MVPLTAFVGHRLLEGASLVAHFREACGDDDPCGEHGIRLIGPNCCRADALDMIREIKAQPLLNGARARPVLDRDELAEVVVRVSKLVEELPEIAELDLNPLVITADRGLVSIDGRVILV
jgi:acyl-CoA synthetase (NDP forming)